MINFFLSHKTNNYLSETCVLSGLVVSDKKIEK